MSVTKTSNPTEYWAGVRIPVWIPDRDDPIHGVLLWRMQALWTEPFFFDYRPWLAISLLVMVIAAVCWVPLVRGLTHSVSRVTEATTRIAGGHFDIKLPTTRRDELGLLSGSINSMAERLSGYVYGQKRFLGDVAHELSSPIARMQVALSILEQRISDEQNSAYIADVQEEIAHMSTLVSELLSFSRARVAAGGAQIGVVNVANTVDRVLLRESTPESTVLVKVDKGLEVTGAPDQLFRALANIVRNAIRYAGAGGPIEISAAADHGRVQIKVVDSGPGVPEAELENLFRPFYRPEFARQRETGGTGLGLAIVRDCVESCGGHVMCRNRTPHGLEVVIELVAPSRHNGAASSL
jgi:two-component system sensor histidine kinase CpxA